MGFNAGVARPVKLRGRDPKRPFTCPKSGGSSLLAFDVEVVESELLGGVARTDQIPRRDIIDEISPVCAGCAAAESGEATGFELSGVSIRAFPVSFLSLCLPPSSLSSSSL